MQNSQIINGLEMLTQAGYKFTRPLVSRSVYHETLQAKTVKAIILDTETTGLDFTTESIIELGMLLFEYCSDTGKIGKVLGRFNQLECPGKPIPEESTKIHGITDEMVLDKRINDDDVSAFIADASLVIAHNAGFDRRFVEARFPIFSTKAWACSQNEIPWQGSKALEFLAYKSGFHYEGHRAINDCEALLEVLHSAILESGQSPLLHMLQSARNKNVKIAALNSLFEYKDLLKARMYFWNAEKKCWIGTVLLSDIESEKEWLKTNVYNNRPFSVEIEQIDAFNRYSNRAGSVAAVRC